MTAVERDATDARTAPRDRAGKSPLRGRDARERVGLAAAGLGALLASFAVSPDGRGALGGALGALALAIAWIDSRRFIVPDVLSAAAFALGLVHAFVASPDAGWEEVQAALVRAAVAVVLFMAVRLAYQRLRGREGLGLGDVKLAAAAGAWLSAPMLPIAIEIAALTGLAVHLWRQRRRKRVVRAAARIPFGAYFALAIWACWLTETRLADWG